MAETTFDERWAELQQKRVRLLHEIQELRKRFNNLPDEPDMKSLLAERDKLRKKLPEMQILAEGDSYADDRRKNWLRTRHKALTDRVEQKYLAKRLKERKERLEKLISQKAPDVIIENERKMIDDIELPIDQLVLVFEERKRQDEAKFAEFRRNLLGAQTRIAEIEAHYRETKRVLEDAVRDAEAAKVAHRAEEVEWGTQSRAHLEWMLANQRTYRDEVLRRYRERFPGEVLPQAASPPVPVPEPVTVYVRERQAPKEESAPVTADPSRPWKFVVTLDPADPGTELPRKEKSFVGALRATLREALFTNLDAAFVRKRLLDVINLSLRERLALKQVVGECDVKGWKIWRAGREYRLLLQIDEATRIVRFVPRFRRDAYDD